MVGGCRRPAPQDLRRVGFFKQEENNKADRATSRACNAKDDPAGTTLQQKTDRACTNKFCDKSSANAMQRPTVPRRPCNAKTDRATKTLQCKDRPCNKRPCHKEDCNATADCAKPRRPTNPPWTKDKLLFVPTGFLVIIYCFLLLFLGLASSFSSASFSSSWSYFCVVSSSSSSSSSLSSPSL